MTRDGVLRTGALLAALGGAMIWFGVRIVRRPDGPARTLAGWTSRRWLREEDVPASVRDLEHRAWGMRVFGRWLVAMGLLVLALGARMLAAVL